MPDTATWLSLLCTFQSGISSVLLLCDLWLVQVCKMLHDSCSRWVTCGWSYRMLQGWVLGDLWLVQICMMLQGWGALTHVKKNEQNPVFLFLKKKLLLCSAFWYGDNRFPSPAVSEGEESCKGEDWIQSCPHVPASVTKPSWLCVLISVPL